MEFKKLTYSVKEVAEVLGVGLANTYELTRRADFPKIKVGRRIVIPIQEFEKWVSTHAYDDEQAIEGGF